MPSTEILDKDDPRPWLLLDVDGVLNACNSSQRTKLYRIFQVEGFRIRMRHELNDWISELTDYFVPVWCTMWNDDANEHLAEWLGLPHLPVIPCTWEIDDTEPWFRLHPKIISIHQHVPQDRAFAWVDDEIGKADQDWAYLRTETTAPTYFVKPVSTSGLQRFHVDRLITWARSLQET